MRVLTVSCTLLALSCYAAGACAMRTHASAAAAFGGRVDSPYSAAPTWPRKAAAPVLSRVSMAEAPRTMSLGAFPFPIDELLLPGERKEMHLYESRFISLFELAQQQGALAAQMLFIDDGKTLALGALLAVEEWTRRDVGVNVVVRAIGRVRLIDVHGTDPYISALFALHQDEPLTTDAQRRALRTQQTEIFALHDACRLARERLIRACDEEGECLTDIPPPSAAAEGASAADAELSPRVTWGHELTSPDSGFATPLKEQVARATEVVLGARARATEGGRAVQWADETAEDVELALSAQLACACFPVNERVRALALEDVSQRFDDALELLKEQRRMLAAKTSLLNAFGSASGE
mmetsp:Transcript_10621/g.27549  ORF Transcript_10621/g.27549 Transcript_10621/m.27549 type:complete len:353 (+) Transcript_10621:44-1102(+)